jgi:hypothetical protein
VEDVAPCSSDVEGKAYFVLDRREPLGYEAPDRRELDTIWQLVLRHRQCPNLHPGIASETREYFTLVRSHPAKAR